MELTNFPAPESTTPEQALVPTIDFAADRLTVSARDLHGFMEVKTKYQDWFPRMCEYGFTEGMDFNFLKIEKVQQEGGRVVTRMIDDAALTIDMAKEICMLQRNERGKQARLYFLQLEKDWNSPEKVMARALKIADAKLKAEQEQNRALTVANVQLAETNAALEAQIEADAPRVMWAKVAEGSKDGMLIREFVKFLRPLGIVIGEKRMFADLREKGYLIKAEGRDRNKPTQKAMELGLFTVKERLVSTPDGESKLVTTPLLTEKGKQYFTKMYLARNTLTVNAAATV